MVNMQQDPQLHLRSNQQDIANTCCLIQAVSADVSLPVEHRTAAVELNSPRLAVLNFISQCKYANTDWLSVLSLNVHRQ